MIAKKKKHKCRHGLIVGMTTYLRGGIKYEKSDLEIVQYKFTVFRF